MRTSSKIKAYFTGIAKLVFPVFYLEVKIMVKINGELLDIAGKTISEYLSSANFDPKRVAVEQNGDIVPKAQYEQTVLNDGDNIEVVSFVGGG